MRARRNPIGSAVTATGNAVPVLVQVGAEGALTHIYDPDLVLYSGATALPAGAPLCGSGYRSPNGKTGDRNIPQLYRSHAKYVTCLRCQKIAQMNLHRYGRYVRPRSE
jgi:hypothetical protein